MLLLSCGSTPNVQQTESSGTKGLSFGLSLHLYPNFVSVCEQRRLPRVRAYAFMHRLTRTYVGMIRKYHNHKLQTNPRHLEEALQDIYSNKTSKRQQKQSNRLSLPRQDDCKARKDTKFCIKTDQHRTPTNNGRHIKQ